MLARDDAALEAGEAKEKFADENGGLEGGGSGFAIEEAASGGVELAENEGVSQVHSAAIALIAAVN